MATRYNKSTMDDICRRLRAGESLLSISRDTAMPSQRTLSDWVSKNHMGFAERYIEAKRVAAHFLAERALEEAYNSANDFYLDDSGRPVFDGHHVQRSKLIIDTIKWEASKMLPKLYGDKVTQEFGVSGDLARLIESASNRDKGLPPPIDTEFDDISESESVFEKIGQIPELKDSPEQLNKGIDKNPRKEKIKRISYAPSSPSNHSSKRRSRRRPEDSTPVQ